MKTSELIEQAKKCATLDIIDAKRCRNCPFNIEEFRLFGSCMDNLIITLCDKLEMAYNDLRKREDCEFCMHAPECRCEYTMLKSTRRECKGWQWRGDKE